MNYHDRKNELRTVVESVIREQLDMIKILSVDAVKSRDFEDDDIIRVTVVFDSPASDFDIDRVLTLVQHLRPKLAEIDEDAFPVVSFKIRHAVEAAA